MTGVVDKSSTLEQNWRKRLLVVIGLCSVAFCIGVPCVTQVAQAPFCRTVLSRRRTSHTQQIASSRSAARQRETELSQFVYSVVYDRNHSDLLRKSAD